MTPLDNAPDGAPNSAGDGMARLLWIMARLRDPETGCPWDIEQAWQTIAPYTIEEAYEVADAIARGSWDDLKGELGDLLLQVVYYAQMGAEEGRFTFDDIARAISDKMIARHPHVFGDETRDKSAEDQTRDWERIKAAERAAVAGDTPSALDGVALALPALSRALKLQKRAARVGFDWTDTRDVLAKIAEEAGELAEARDQLTPDAVEDEMGDLLFVVTNLARHLDVDPEAALRRTNAKFERRFRAIEATLTEQGRSTDEASLEDMDAIWTAIKQREKSASG